MRIIEYDIKAVSVDPKQNRSIIKVPYPKHHLVKDALKKYKRLRVIIETIDKLSKKEKEEIKKKIENIRYVEKVEIGKDRFIIYTEGEDYEEDKFLRIQEDFERRFTDKFGFSPEPDENEMTRWNVKFDKFIYN